MDFSGSLKRWYGLYNPLEGNIYLVWLYTTYHPLQEPEKSIDLGRPLVHLGYLGS